MARGTRIHYPGAVYHAMARGVDGLVEVDPGLELPAAPVFLAYHRQLRGVPRVRAVAAAVEAALRAAL